MDAAQGDPKPAPPAVGAREIRPLSVEEVSERIRVGSGLSTIKLNHGFWERLVRLEDELGMAAGTSLADAGEAELAAAMQRLQVPWPATLLLALLEAARSRASAPELLILASPLGWRGGYSIEGTPVVGLDRVLEAIDRYIPASVPVYDGLVWKNAIEDGSFAGFVEELRDRPVLIAAPDYVRDFPAHAGLRNVAFIPVHRSRAAWEAEDTLKRISAAIGGAEGAPVTLVEAGGLTSSWLCAELAERSPGSVNLSLGQALNLFAVEQIRRTNWFCIQGARIRATARAIDPAADRLWPADGSAAAPGPFWRPVSTGGRDLALSRLTAKASASALGGGHQIPFVERKQVDQELAQELLGLSARADRFANFGPVSRLLEDAIAELLDLPPTKSVVMCKSATAGLHLLVGVHEHKRGTPLRWVISAFGFLSTAIGPLANATVLDCDPRGILDIERLERLPDDAWDGLILTNPFSLAQDLDPYTELCRRKGKLMVLDSAAALFSAVRGRRDHLPDEVISFHQTKPWGIGEGGCMILDAADADIARSLANFGVGLGPRARRHASNSKYSDYDSALVLQRLVNLPRWADLYRLQAVRVRAIAAEAGLHALAPVPEGSLVGNLPMLAPAPIDQRRLTNPHLALRKYYRPLADDAPQAAEIYGRIVNIPCHPGVAECPTEALAELVTDLQAAD